MSTPESHVVGGADGTTGDRGEVHLARTAKVALRVWEGEDAGVRAEPHANPYDYVGYVLAGALEVTIGDEPAAEVRAGDSFAVPADTTYSFLVTETAKVVEAVAPGDAI